VKRLTGLDWPLLGLGLGLLLLSAAGALWITSFDDANAGVLPLLQSVPYAVAVWLILKRPPDNVDNGRALVTILVIALAMRLVLLPGTPVSTDIFRYVWDGRVQGVGVNPYLHLPAADALSHLRDADIYPYINRADYAPTIYPPASQIVFYLVTRISQTPVAMKATMVVFEGLAVWTILQLLAARGLPRSRVLLYAWHPLPLWEFARSGHIDIVAIAFLLLALLATERRSPVLAGVALGAGVMVKYFPVVAAPALYRRGDWRFPAAFVAAVAVLYLPYIGAGAKVFGFLGGYLSEEGFDRGTGIFLWQLLSLPQGLALAVYLPAAALVMVALALFVLMRERGGGTDLAGALLLATAFTVLSSPHYPWYFAWLVPLLCFHPIPGVLYLTCAASYLYFAHWPPSVADGLVIYGPFAVLLIADFALRLRRKPEERHAGAVPA
jgi:alpha-1,6-mannosyltransferase